MSNQKLLICPYCGATQRAGEQCAACGGRFDSMSRRATHNEMGPWFVRTEGRAFHPGCAYETIVRRIERGEVTKVSVVRGPTTRQFWTIARRVPGLAHLLGYCHECDGRVEPSDHNCPHCGVAFGAYLDRDWLGLPEVRPLPGDAPGPEDSGSFAASGPGWPELTPAPVAPGLSSFGRDEELMQPAAPDQRGGVAAATAPRVAATERPADPTPEQVMRSPITQALQRRIARQEGANRILVVLLVVSLLGGVLFNLWALGKLGGGRAEDAASPPAATGDAEYAAPIVDDEPSAAPAPAVEGGIEAEGIDGADGDPAPAAPAAPAEPAPVPVDEAYARAMDLLREAARAESSTVRLTRLREARTELEDAAARLAGDARPEDLDRRLAEVAREIERLELEAFFGDG